MKKKFNLKHKRIRLTPEQREVFIEMSKKILWGLLIGAGFTVAMSNPTALHRFIQAYLRDKEKLSESDAEIVYDKLRKDRFVKICRRKGKQMLRITDKGRRQLIEFNIDALKIQKQKWDGKWRIVIFDIPEKLRLARRVLRDKLKEIGFIKIQKSVWVCPYECENEINFIAEVYEVGQYVNYIVAEKIDIDKTLRSKFDL